MADSAIKALLALLGYSSLYPPQELAISAGILEGRNMLVTTPTASGKTLIAMMAIVKALERGSKAAYLTPLRALASEKYDDLRLLEQIDINGRRPKVSVATSDYDSSGKELATADVIILTNEKMDTLFRHNAEWLGDIGLFVSDEIHLIGEKERGPTLEMMLTKVRMHYPKAQIVALSATVANSEELAGWLGCKLVESDWRPTTLVEGVYEHGTVRLNNKTRFKLEGSGVQGAAAVDLAIDSLGNGGQALIFAETRKRAASLAAKAAEGIYRRLDKDGRDIAARASSEILAKGDDSELTKTLAQLVAKGVAFHHAGLGPSSRGIVEDSFKKGTVKVLAATPTLAAGVNLPARRVVVASILRYDSDYGGSVPISVLEYKQLCGRAGRPKYDTAGEAIIVSDGVNGEDLFDHYVLGVPEPIRSQLSNDRAVRFHLLAAIATMPGMKKEEIQDLFGHTLFAQQYRTASVSFKVDSALNYLEQEELIKSRNDRYIATEFGRRTSLLYIDPITAVEIRNAIQQTGPTSKPGRHTVGFLHLIANTPDFFPKLSLRKKDYEEVSLLIQERNNELLYDVSEYDFSRSLWALCEWLEETTDKILSDKMGVEPGDMHRIVETSVWLAYSLYEVAKLMRRVDLLPELYNLRTRIRYGVKDELLPLVSLEGIGRARARALFSAGLTDIAKIAKAPEEKLASVSKIGPSVARKIKDQLGKKRPEQQ